MTGPSISRKYSHSDGQKYLSALPALCVVVVLLSLLVPGVHGVAPLDLDLAARRPAGEDVLPELAVRAVLELVVLQEVVRPGLGRVTELGQRSQFERERLTDNHHLPVQSQELHSMLGSVEVVALKTFSLVLRKLKIGTLRQFQVNSVSQ